MNIETVRATVSKMTDDAICTVLNSRTVAADLMTLPEGDALTGLRELVLALTEEHQTRLEMRARFAVGCAD